MNEEPPPPQEGDIVIRGTYTTRSGQEVPVEIHTGTHGLIYQTWRAQQEARGAEVRELKEGEVIEPQAYQRFSDPQYFQKQALPADIPDSRGRTLIEVFAREKARDLAQIQGRLDELRAQLKLTTVAEGVREEILDLEKKLLGDP